MYSDQVCHASSQGMIVIVTAKEACTSFYRRMKIALEKPPAIAKPVACYKSLIERMCALPFEHCVKFMSQHI